jgi:hypothetical protein
LRKRKESLFSNKMEFLGGINRIALEVTIKCWQKTYKIALLSRDGEVCVAELVVDCVFSVPVIGGGTAS